MFLTKNQVYIKYRHMSSNNIFFSTNVKIDTITDLMWEIDPLSSENYQQMTAYYRKYYIINKKLYKE